jgi:hypothetical protein
LSGANVATITIPLIDNVLIDNFLIDSVVRYNCPDRIFVQRS